MPYCTALTQISSITQSENQGSELRFETGLKQFLNASKSFRVPLLWIKP